MPPASAYDDPDGIASLGGGNAAIDGENCQVASVTASNLRVLVTSGAGRGAAGQVCETSGMNTSRMCGWLAFMPFVPHTARLRRAAGRLSWRAFR